MITLYHITPYLIMKDPDLVLTIMQFEYTHLLAISILVQKLNKKERRKHWSVWVQRYLKHCITHGHHDNLLRELALTIKDIIQKLSTSGQGLVQQDRRTISAKGDI